MHEGDIEEGEIDYKSYEEASPIPAVLGNNEM